MRVLAHTPMLGRVNPFVPGFMVVVGFILMAAGFRWIGAGIAVGSVLALINGMLLSRRVEFAVDTGDMARAMMIMQLGLALTFTVVGLSTVILIKLSLAMAVASAVGFGVTQMGILAAYYWARGRSTDMEQAS